MTDVDEKQRVESHLFELIERELGRAFAAGCGDDLVLVLSDRAVAYARARVAEIRSGKNAPTSEDHLRALVSSGHMIELPDGRFQITAKGREHVEAMIKIGKPKGEA